MAKTKKKTFTEPYHIEMWFERDRAHVELLDADNQTIIEWWDEEVQKAIDDGFLYSSNYLESAEEYAKSVGML